MDDDVASDAGVMANASRTCEYDIVEAKYKLHKVGHNLITKNGEINKRVEFPHLFDRTGRFSGEPQYFFTNIHPSMDRIKPQKYSISEQ